MTKYSKEVIADAIDRTAEFIAHNPDKWTKATLAVDFQGQSVDPRSGSARCWCALGRIVKELDLNPADVVDPEDIEELDERPGEYAEAYYCAFSNLGVPYNQIYNSNDGIYGSRQLQGDKETLRSRAKELATALHQIRLRFLRG